MRKAKRRRRKASPLTRAKRKIVDAFASAFAMADRRGVAWLKFTSDKRGGVRLELKRGRR